MIEGYRISRFGPLGLDHVRIHIFTFTVLFYGFFGTPTPDEPGFIEMIIAAGLLLTASVQGLALSLQYHGRTKDIPLWAPFFALWFMYGIVVLLPYSLMSGHAVNTIIRDVIPFLFWLLPLFVYDLIRSGRLSVRKLVWIIAIAGLIQAARHLLNLLPRMGESGFFAGTIDLLYLPNEASVMFAALYFLGSGLFNIVKGQNIAAFGKGIFFFSLSIIPFLAMASMVQRATLVLSFIIFLVWLVMLWRYYPLRALVFGLLMGAFIYLFGQIQLENIVHLLWEKTQIVGSNARFDEMSTIIGLVSEDMRTLLLGYGWGTEFSSPAVGGLWVGYTHNFFTTLWLKTGLIGLVLGILSFGALLWLLLKIWITRPVIALALSMPLMICLMLYASFKSLGFGLIILLIASMAFQQKEPWPDRREALN